MASLPTVITDLSATAASNYPAGSDAIGTSLDDLLRADASFIRMLFDTAIIYSSTVGGTADVITLTPTPALTAYKAGQGIAWIASGANTTNVTVNVSGLGAKAVTKRGSTALVAGDIGGLSLAIYDGTQFQLLSPAVLSGLAAITGGTINNSVIGGSTPAAGTFTSLNTTGTGGGASVVFADTANAGGSNIQLSGNGVTTPNKFIRAASGVLQFLNNAYSVIGTLTDAGALTLTGTVTANGVLLTGGLVQSVNTAFAAVATGTTLIPDDDTIPQITEGTEFMTQAITPTKSANKLKITIVVNHATSAQTNIYGALFQDATANALAAWNMNQINVANSPMSSTFVYYMTAGTTSATTFRFRMGPGSANTVTLNGYGGARKMGGVYASSMTIEELAA